MLGSLLAIAGFTFVFQKPRYTLWFRFGSFEIRHYEPCLVAETTAVGEFASAGIEGVHRLSAYLKGENDAGRRLGMSTPALQRLDEAGMTTQLVVPAQDPASPPRPEDARIMLRPMPARTLAVICYAGSWSRLRFEDALARLHQHIEQAELETVGAPLWARYNPPCTPSFLRRNEVMLELKEGTRIPGVTG